jgi:hypothetical protein
MPDRRVLIRDRIRLPPYSNPPKQSSVNVVGSGVAKGTNS